MDARSRKQGEACRQDLLLPNPFQMISANPGCAQEHLCPHRPEGPLVLTFKGGVCTRYENIPFLPFLWGP